MRNEILQRRSETLNRLLMCSRDNIPSVTNRTSKNLTKANNMTFDNDSSRNAGLNGMTAFVNVAPRTEGFIAMVRFQFPLYFTVDVSTNYT